MFRTLHSTPCRNHLPIKWSVVCREIYDSSSGNFWSKVHCNDIVVDIFNCIYQLEIALLREGPPSVYGDRDRAIEIVPRAKISQSLWSWATIVFACIEVSGSLARARFLLLSFALTYPLTHSYFFHLWQAAHLLLEKDFQAFRKPFVEDFQM